MTVGCTKSWGLCAEFEAALERSGNTLLFDVFDFAEWGALQGVPWCVGCGLYASEAGVMLGPWADISFLNSHVDIHWSLASTHSPKIPENHGKRFFPQLQLFVYFYHGGFLALFFFQKL